MRALVSRDGKKGVLLPNPGSSLWSMRCKFVTANLHSVVLRPSEGRGVLVPVFTMRLPLFSISSTHWPCARVPVVVLEMTQAALLFWTKV
jgi:hypothetical protein